MPRVNRIKSLMSGETAGTVNHGCHEYPLERQDPDSAEEVDHLKMFMAQHPDRRGSEKKKYRGHLKTQHQG
jgi:hypothetical protein